MVQVRYGGKNGKTVSLEVSESLLAVRTHERRLSVVAAAPESAVTLSPGARAVLRDAELVWSLPAAGVEVVQTPSIVQRDDARGILQNEPAVRFAGRVLRNEAGEPILYTENLFVKFDDEEEPARCEEILANYQLAIKRRLAYARNAWFAAAPEGTGQMVFEISEALLQEAEVQYCHPELIRPIRARAMFPQQWHLAPTTLGGQLVDAHANVVNAWAITQGQGTTIAVIDQGIDTDHEEFRSSGKIVAPRDVTSADNDPRPVFANETHGTPCAGVACGDGNFGASGVAPRARLMPIRYVSELGGQQEADAFEWAARNGADVISCSWGPDDGLGIPQLLPDSTRMAIDFAVTNGRNGKGTVVLFAAGNGDESVDLDGYASYRNVIAVAACTDRNVRASYSDFGDAVWCTFPSSGGLRRIWTADNSGKPGRNPGGQFAEGDVAGNYTSTFGGTSSACPGAAGVVALMLSANPALRWDEVRDILRRNSDPIDVANGQYDANGHSPFYGYGRVNALRAVQASLPLTISNRVTRRIAPNAPISDLGTVTAVLNVSDRLPVKALKAEIEIEHTWVGDLTVTLHPPAGNPILLHARQGGSADNLKKTYDFASTPALQALQGQLVDGDWRLEVSDAEAQDQGVLKSFALEIDF